LIHFSFSIFLMDWYAKVSDLSHISYFFMSL
jgi:hypothetical protein